MQARYVLGSIPLIICGFLAISLMGEDIKDPDNFEKKLLNDLIIERRIDRFSRPVQHHNHTLNANFYLLIFKVLGLDDQTQVLTVHGFMHWVWRDFNLTWNPADYGGLKKINIPDVLIWKPDIVLNNGVKSPQIHTSLERTWNSAVVFSDGKVKRSSPLTNFQVQCPMDVRSFPFDEHDCVLQFSSWTFKLKQINITFSPDFEPTNKEEERRFVYHGTDSHDWEVIDTSSRHRVVSYSTGNYSYLEFRIRLRRKSPFYQLAVMAPSLSMMTVLLALFWLPPASSEKLTLSGLVTIILTILLVLMQWVLPRNSGSIPALVMFCGVALAFSLLSLTANIITITMSRSRSKNGPPRILTSLLMGKLGTIFCLTTGKSATTEKPSKRSGPELLVENDILESNEDTVVVESPDRPKPTEVNWNRNDWELLATAIDRLFFVIYCLIFAILLPLSTY